jgi:hypothetical protein
MTASHTNTGYSWVGVLLALVVLMPLVWVGGSGCGAAPANGTAPTDAEKKPTFDATVSTVEQLNQLGDKRADGQFVVAKVSLANQSASDRVITFAHITLALQPEDQAKPTYTQPPEMGANVMIMKAYGVQEGDKVLKSPAETFHPQVKAQRYCVFLLPSDANLADYRIIWTPPAAAATGGFAGLASGAQDKVASVGFEIPLVGPQTKVVDKRLVGQ